MSKIKEAIEKVTLSAKNNNPDERFIKEIEIGKCVRQGDIYIHRVNDDHNCGDKAASSQLAKGTSKGSRHFAEAPAVVYESKTTPEWCSTTLLGPCVKSTSRFTVSHPEHANISLPGGTYQITHQMDARTLEKVRD